jgi:putative ABC transport system permease protein
MKRNSIVKSGFQIMKRYKLRTFFMMLGIIIGVTALTLILSLGKGTRQKLMNRVERVISSSNILISATRGEIRGGPRSHESTTTLTLEDLKELREQIPNIENYDPMQMIPSRSVKYKEKSLDLRIMGNSPNAEEIWDRGVTSGSFYTEMDMKQSARVALVGTAVVKELFDGIDPVGEQIRIGSVPFRVIGVLESMGIDAHGRDRENEISIPVTTMMRRLMNVDYIRRAKLQLADKSRMEETAAQIRQILRERHHINADEPDDFMIITPVKVQQILSLMTNVFSILLPLIAGIALLAGGVVIAALMLIMVNERTGEIGLRKAVGARAKDILRQFIIETTVITVTGGFFGFLLGTIGVQVLVIRMKLPAVLPWEAFILGMVFSAIVGMAAGLIPARRAASLDPVETLR